MKPYYLAVIALCVVMGCGTYEGDPSQSVTQELSGSPTVVNTASPVILNFSSAFPSLLGYYDEHGQRVNAYKQSLTFMRKYKYHIHAEINGGLHDCAYDWYHNQENSTNTGIYKFDLSIPAGSHPVTFEKRYEGARSSTAYPMIISWENQKVRLVVWVRDIARTPLNTCLKLMGIEHGTGALPQ